MAMKRWMKKRSLLSGPQIGSLKQGDLKGGAMEAEIQDEDTVNRVNAG